MGNPGVDPVVLFKIVFIQYLYGIRSMRQTIKEIDVNVAYRWFIGYDLTEPILHFSTFGKNYKRRFEGTDIFERIFRHILEEAVRCGFVDASAIFIDGTHIRANANKKKYVKEVVAVEAKSYQKALDKEIKAPPHKKVVAKRRKKRYNKSMNKQMSLSFIHDELKEVKTHKKEFLEQIERIMPWEELEELVRPHYYAGIRGNKPYDLELMLRIHLLQNLYTLSDEGTRNEVVDSHAFSDFCGVESSNQIPDGDTIGRFLNFSCPQRCNPVYSYFLLII